MAGERDTVEREMKEVEETIDSDAYVPMRMWGRDHWSTLAYIESVEVECRGFQIGYDPRMKSNRRHFRVMREECPRPKRPTQIGDIGFPMELKHSTVLKDGRLVEGHDDWMCVQDMASEGLFTADVSDVQPGATLRLSAKGRRIASQIREHKASGGNFSNFVAETEE